MAAAKFVIPGLWDMHMHWYDAGTLPLFIVNRVTGARVTLGTPLHHRWRNEIAAGGLVGPRFVIGSRLIDGPRPVFSFAITVKDATDARQAVLKAKQDGAEFIKIYELLSRDAFFAIADDSRKQGIPFAGHVPTSVSVEEASRAGQRSIEHDRFMLATTSREEDLRKLIDEAYAKTPTGSGFPKIADWRHISTICSRKPKRRRTDEV